MTDLEQYLDVLFDGLEGLVYSPVKRPTSWKQTWFEYPRQRQELIDHIEGNVDGDVYISPAVYNDRIAKQPYIKRLQAVWVEFDGVDRIDFRGLPEPSMIVQTSFAGHVHCYWNIDSTNNTTTIDDVNRRLTYFLGADYSGWDSTQLLRPPGTFNHKRQLPVVLADKQNTHFTVGHFSQVPEVSIPASATVEVENLIPTAQVLKDRQLSSKLTKMILKESPKEPYRSSFLARLAFELAEEGLNVVEIVSLLKEADERIEKFSGRSDQLLRLTQLADLAIHKAQVEHEVIIYDTEYILKYVDNLQWIIPQWLHTTGQMLISSAPAVGKTQLCCQLAYCLQEGERWLGFLAPSKHKVLFMTLEMDKAGIKYILTHQKEEWNRIPGVKWLDEPGTLIKYEDIIDENEFTVVIVDSMIELFDDEHDNANSEARRVMKWVRKIRRRYGVAVVLIHHNRKATEGNKKPKTIHDLAGSYIFAKDTDTALQLWKDNKGIELSTVKVRYGMDDTFFIERNKNLWFTRKQDVSNEQRSIPADSQRTERHENTSSGHRDEHNRFVPGKISFGFGHKGRE